MHVYVPKKFRMFADFSKIREVAFFMAAQLEAKLGTKRPRSWRPARQIGKFLLETRHFERGINPTLAVVETLFSRQHTKKGGFTHTISAE